ncbi:unnamed protein product, partial [Prorocentrum cordatum]
MVGKHMRQGGDPDGRACIICGVCDTDNDPVDLEFDVAQPMSWRRPATPDGKQEGRGCYYCFAVFRARYKIKGQNFSFAKLPQVLGSNGAQFDKFMGYRKTLVAWLIEKGGRGARVVWDQIDNRVISLVTVKATEVIEPDDLLWDYEHYVAEKGDPATNGLGRVVTYEHGKKEVKVPSAPIRRVRRKTGQIVEDRREVHNGDADAEMYDGQGDEMLQELMQMIELPRATGECQRPGVSSVPASSSTDRPVCMPAVDPTVAASDSRGNFGGLSIGFARSDPGPSQVAARAGTKTQPGRRQTAGRGKNTQQTPDAPPANPPGGRTGPKRRNICSTAESLCKDFFEAGATDELFFGKSWKHHTRYCKRVYDDIEARIASLKSEPASDDQASELSPLQMWVKKVSSLRAFCGQMNLTGVESAKFSEVYDSQIAFLALVPTCDIESFMPDHLRQSRFNQRVSSTADADTFRSLVAVDSITKTGRYQTSEAVEKQRAFVTERLLSIAKQPDIETTLQAFCPSQPEKFDWQTRLPDLVSDLVAVAAVARHDELRCHGEAVRAYIEIICVKQGPYSRTVLLTPALEVTGLDHLKEAVDSIGMPTSMAAIIISCNRGKVLFNSASLTLRKMTRYTKHCDTLTNTFESSLLAISGGDFAALRGFATTMSEIFLDVGSCPRAAELFEATCRQRSNALYEQLVLATKAWAHDAWQHLRGVWDAYASCEHVKTWFVKFDPGCDKFELFDKCVAFCRDVLGAFDVLSSDSIAADSAVALRGKIESIRALAMEVKSEVTSIAMDIDDFISASPIFNDSVVGGAVMSAISDKPMRTFCQEVETKFKAAIESMSSAVVDVKVGMGMSATDLAQVSGFRIASDEHIATMVAFSDEVKDATLKSEISYLCAWSSLRRAAALAITYVNAGNVDQGSFNVLARLHSELGSLKQFIDDGHAKDLFVQAPGRVATPFKIEAFKMPEAAESVVEDCTAVIFDSGRRFLAVLNSETTGLTQEIGEDWRDQRGSLATNSRLILPMCKNPSIKTMGSRAAQLADMAKMLRQLNGRLSSLGAIVPEESLRVATQTATWAIHTVAMTSVLFGVRVDIRRLTKDKQPAAAQKLLDLLREKKVDPGADVLAALVAFGGASAALQKTPAAGAGDAPPAEAPAAPAAAALEPAPNAAEAAAAAAPEP